MNNKKALEFWSKLADKADSPLCVKLAYNNDFTDFDVKFIMQYADKTSNILDIGSGTGITINKYYDKVNSIVALEKFEKFSDFIDKTSKIKVVNSDAFEFETDEKFDLITMFGFIHYFNEDETVNIYKI